MGTKQWADSAERLLYYSIEEDVNAEIQSK